MRRLGVLVLVAACGTSPGIVTPQITPIPDPPPPPQVDTSATGLWNSVIGTWPRLDGERVEALAITPISPWGKVAVGWADTINDRYVVRSGRRGPYHPRIDGAPLAIDDAAAHVVEVTMTSAEKLVNQPVKVADVRVLPINAVAILDDAAARWTAHLAEQQGAIDAALTEADRTSAGHAYTKEATQITDGFGPSWLPVPRQLQVIYVRKIVRSSALLERFGGGGGCNKYKGIGGPGANEAGFPEERELVACQPPREDFRQHTRAYSIDVGLVLRYSADGRLVSARPYAPHPVPNPGPF